MAVQTGLGATLTAPNGWTTTLYSIGGVDFTAERQEDTHLNNTTKYAEYIHSEIVDHGEFTAEIDWYPDELNPEFTSGLGFLGGAGTLTITFPSNNAAHATAGSISGTGNVIGFATPQLTPRDKTVATITCSFDGKSFTFTSQTT